VGTAELRFPLLTPQVFRNLPSAVPPIEAALFFDIGLAWEEGNTVTWSREAGDDPVKVREPLMTYGASVRSNLFGFLILRLDYSRPLRREGINHLWTLSLGPAF
jgi:outer membrane protein assembly factor BamA